MIATLGFIAIIAAAVACAVGMFKGRKESVSSIALAAACAALFTQLALRSVSIGFPALTGMFESLVFYSLVVCLVALLYGLTKKNAPVQGLHFGLIMVALVLLALASSPIAPKAVQPPMPALRSGWLVAHVALSFIGEAFFAFSFVASIMILARRNRSAQDAPADAKRYDRLAYLSVVVGYPVFTIGALIFGAVWAQSAWGRWWSWDPKETWALVTWFLYTAYLHVRLIMKKDGRLLAWINVLGFACTLFTFFGVNFLLAGLHSYR